MVYDPLGSENVIQHMADALPTHAKDDTTSDLSDSYQSVALFAHACMVSVGFRLLGFREGQSIESELAKTSPRLSPKWSEAFGSHSFLYAHTQSSMQYVIKIDRLGGKAEIRGIGLGDDKITRLEIVAKDYVNSTALPLRIKIKSDGGEDRVDLFNKLKELFKNPSCIQDLTTKFKSEIIQKLIPGLHKEGYEETVPRIDSEGQRSRQQRDERDARYPRGDYPRPEFEPSPARPHPFADPLAAAPARRPLPDPMPGFDDELEILRPSGRYAPPSRSPFGNIGHDDLNPPGLGPYDPLRGSFTGGGQRPGGFGGMHPTFEDPVFGGQGGGQGQFNPSAPPGARFDPVGPGFGLPRGATGPSGGPGGPFGGGGGHNPYNPDSFL